MQTQQTNQSTTSDDNQCGEEDVNSKYVKNYI